MRPMRWLWVPLKGCQCERKNSGGEDAAHDYCVRT